MTISHPFYLIKIFMKISSFIKNKLTLSLYYLIHILLLLPVSAKSARVQNWTFKMAITFPCHWVISPTIYSVHFFNQNLFLILVNRVFCLHSIRLRTSLVEFSVGRRVREQLTRSHFERKIFLNLVFLIIDFVNFFCWEGSSNFDSGFIRYSADGQTVLLILCLFFGIKLIRIIIFLSYSCLLLRAFFATIEIAF